MGKYTPFEENSHARAPNVDAAHGKLNSIQQKRKDVVVEINAKSYGHADQFGNSLT